MEKFTKIKKQPQAQIPAPAYQGKNFTVTSHEENEMINESDTVVILPYFKDEGFILLKHENVASYKYRYKDDLKNKNLDRFLTVISSPLAEGEGPIQTVRRELYESSGIILSNLYPLEITEELFMTKNSTGKYYTFLLELNYNDFKQVMNIDDQNKKVSNSIKVSIGDIDDIQIHDLLTRYMLLKLKFEYKIK